MFILIAQFKPGLVVHTFSLGSKGGEVIGKRQTDFCEVETNLVYTVSTQPAQIT